MFHVLTLWGPLGAGVSHVSFISPLSWQEDQINTCLMYYPPPSDG